MTGDRQRRRIVHIDEDRCDGCGLCATACAEGAIHIVDGKARLISEIYCDGLGACLGECPRGAITIEERLAEAFDPIAVEHRLGQLAQPEPCGCPSAQVRSMHQEVGTHPRFEPAPVSVLGNWPVQLRLVPLSAPYLQDARLLVTADCVPLAYPDFHRRFLPGKVALLGCPKLDDAAFYRSKLADLLRQNPIQSIEVVFMEVPCCTGLARLTIDALQAAGNNIPLRLTQISIGGNILGSQVLSKPAP